MKSHLLLIPVMLVLLAGCSEESTAPDPSIETGAPQILSLSAVKTQILYGGQDPAIITCNATGGNLTYVWSVDIGDIIPLNSDRSKVSFNGTACCMGEKLITCTVSNSLGSVSKTITITILETVVFPEILVMEADKTEIHAGTGETAALVCFALGGNLNYAWKSDCGAVTADPLDPTKATMTASAECKGARTVTCTVSNEKGVAVQTMQINVVD